jgi:cbb3-type cytochrome oxidase maturation protein
MDILFLLIPISVVLVFVIAVMFWWFVRTGQFDDLEGPGFKVLMDDDAPIDAGARKEAPPVQEDDKSVQKS